MNRTWMARGLALATVASLGGLVAAFASCAANEEASDGSVEPDAATLPEASSPKEDPVVEQDAEVIVDGGGCDAADPTCNTHVINCDDVAFCKKETGVNSLYVLTNVFGTAANDVWAVGSGGTIAHYDGTTWTITPTGVQNTFLSVWASGPNDVYAINNTDFVYHSTGFQNGTATWQQVPTVAAGASAAPARVVWGTSADHVRIGARAYNVPGVSGTYDQFIKTTGADGGITWRPIPGTPTVRGYWASSPTDVWMISDNSTYVQFERARTQRSYPNPDGGAFDAGPEAGIDAGLVDPLAWTPVDSQTNVVLDAIWGSSANDVWTVGGSGTIRHITQNDGRWQPVASPTFQNLHGIWGSGPNDFWIVGDGGTILHYDGTAFESVSAEFPIGRKPNLFGIWGSGPNDIWIVGDGITLHYTGPKPGAQGVGQ